MRKRIVIILLLATNTLFMFAISDSLKIELVVSQDTSIYVSELLGKSKFYHGGNIQWKMPNNQVGNGMIRIMKSQEQIFEEINPFFPKWLEYVKGKGVKINVDYEQLRKSKNKETEFKFQKVIFKSYGWRTNDEYYLITIRCAEPTKTFSVRDVESKQENICIEEDKPTENSSIYEAFPPYLWFCIGGMVLSFLLMLIYFLKALK